MSNSNAEKGNSEGKARVLGKKPDNIGGNKMLIIGTNYDDFLEGSDDDEIILALGGDDIVIGNHDEYVASNIAGVVTIPPIPDFGMDELFGGQGDDELYGDIRKIVLKAEAGFDTGLNNLWDIWNGEDFALASDILFGDMGNDFLVGDAGEILLSAVGGTATTVNNTNGDIRSNSFVMADDDLYGGSGMDELYGDVYHLRLEAISGTVTADSDPGVDRARGIIVGNIFTMGDDDLYGGSESDKLYGDIGLLELFAQGGNSLSSGDSTTAFLQSNTFIMGNDTLYGDQGSDELYGDIGELRIEGIAGLNTEGNASNAQIFSNTFTMGNDYLFGGSEMDLLVGDIGTFNTTGISGVLSSSTGNAQTFIPSVISLGNDELWGGMDQDSLYGDIAVVNVEATSQLSTSSGGNTETWVSAIPFGLPYVLDAGEDWLYGETGDDHLVGDIGDINIVLTGGTAIVEGSTDAKAIFEGAQFLMEIDHLYGGSGNDNLIGDIESFNASLIGGTATALGTESDADLLELNLVFGDDELFGENGNDRLIGDVEDIALIATDGTEANGGLARALFALPGNDARDDGSAITFGDDVIDGGSGNDYLVGDVVNFIGLEVFIEDLNFDPDVFNQIIWGDDELTGGSGVDTFAFTLVDASVDDVMTEANSDGIIDTVQGDDTIVDLSLMEGDILRFDDVSDFDLNGMLEAADLDVISVFDSSMDVGGDAAVLDTVITFDGGGTLTLLDITVTDFASIAANVEVNG